MTSRGFSSSSLYVCFCAHVVDVDGKWTYNWAKLVLQWLYDEVKKYKMEKQTYCGGCVLLLVYV